MSTSPSFETYLAREWARTASACTACGRCVEVCPVVPFAEINAMRGGAITGEVRDLLRPDDRVSSSLSNDTRRWIDQCNGCGECIPACPESINPRRMLSLAQQSLCASGQGTPEVFRKMAHAVRLMAAAQLIPQDFTKLLPRAPRTGAPVIFYFGCNALRTPNVLLDAMTVLDALGVDYEVAGGPKSCCGVVHTRTEGTLAAGGRVVNSTVVQFNAAGAERVLTWCPSCQLQIGETVAGFRELKFDLDHITAFLMEHRDALERRWCAPVKRKVVLHVHDGFGEFGQHVQTLLDTVPGLERVDTVVESGYTCGAAGSDRSAGRRAHDRARLFARVRETGADTVVSLYHGCHRSLLQDGIQEGFETVNFTAVLAEALGHEPYPDGYSAMLAPNDPRSVAGEAQRFLADNGFDYDIDWVSEHLRELMTMAEYRGGLECFGSAPEKIEQRR